MRSLITGVGGFAGQYLAARLLDRGDDTFGVARQPIDWHQAQVPSSPGFELIVGDLTFADDARRAVEVAEPGEIYLLAAMSSVPDSFADPLSAIHNNLACVVNVLEAVREAAPEARVLVVSSSEIYGPGASSRPIDEAAPLRPASPYAVSKAAIDLLGYQYHAAYAMHIVRVRPFNHIGPGQSDRFVTANFARQIAEIEAGLREPVIEVGNLDARRDFTDVRDMVGAYALALESGEPGAAYNVGCGDAVMVRSLLDRLAAVGSVSVEVRLDRQRLRPIDAPLLACDSSRFRARTGWHPSIPLDQTLNDILAYWRARVARR